MPVKIRLQRRGRRKKPYYHIVVADVRAPRDGRFIEQIGSYNPMTSPATIEIDTERALDWLNKGAQPTNTARAILRFRGVLYKKHLQRGVEKGALTQEEADRKYNEFMQEKDARIAKRFEETQEAERKRLAAISGVSPLKEVVEEAAAEETSENGDPAVAENGDPSTTENEADQKEDPSGEVKTEEGSEAAQEIKEATETEGDKPVEDKDESGSEEE